MNHRVISSYFCIFLFFSFLATPSITHAKMYTWDPVGRSYLVVENPIPCPVTWYMFYEDGSLLSESYIPAAFGGGTSRLAVVMNRTLFQFDYPVLRGEQLYFGYKIIPSSGSDCDNEELVTMENRIVSIDELEFVPPVKIRTYTLRDSNYVYDLITFPNEFKIHIYTLPYDPQPPYIEREIYHPVIFLHGLGGKPSDWTTGNKKIYWEKFKEAGYPEDFLATYHYADSDGNPDTYDYQGDITKIDDDLPALVDSMAAKYEEKYGDCNDECVDVVAFSLGGVVTRQYLNEHMFDNKLRKVVTVGSPHQGSFWLEGLNWIENLHFGGENFKQALLNLGSSIFGQIFSNADPGNPITMESPAVQQLRPNSNFLTLFNQYLYSDISFEAVFGNIDFFATQELFHFNLSTPTISLGDAIVSTNSAVAVNTSDLTTTMFSDESKNAQGNILLVKKDKTYSYTLDLPTLDELKYFHNNLILQEEVVDQALKYLRI